MAEKQGYHSWFYFNRSQMVGNAGGLANEGLKLQTHNTRKKGHK